MPRLPESIWIRRFENELAELSKAGVKFVRNANQTQFILELNGPGYSFEGGRLTQVTSHRVRIDILRDYPYAGGIDVTWLTPIYHPNIRSDGKVCIQILNSWSEGLTLMSLVKGLGHLLKAPNPKDPLNKEAAKYFVEHGLADGEFTKPKPGRPRVVL